jgi:hypothetical protein
MSLLTACIVVLTALAAPALADELIVTETGNVGIGVTEPEQKLHVFGGRVYFDSGFGGNTVN